MASSVPLAPAWGRTIGGDDTTMDTLHHLLRRLVADIPPVRPEPHRDGCLPALIVLPIVVVSVVVTLLVIRLRRLGRRDG